MNSHPLFVALIQEFASLIQINGLEPDENGRCGVIVEGHSPVVIQLARHQEGNETVTIYTVLGTVLQEKRTTVLELCMNANLFWQGTMNATIGLDSTDDTLVIARQFPLTALDAGTLAEAVRQLSDTAAGWQHELNELYTTTMGATTSTVMPVNGATANVNIVWG